MGEGSQGSFFFTGGGMLFINPGLALFRADSVFWGIHTLQRTLATNLGRVP